MSCAELYFLSGTVISADPVARIDDVFVIDAEVRRQAYVAPASDRTVVLLGFFDARPQHFRRDGWVSGRPPQPLESRGHIK